VRRLARRAATVVTAAVALLGPAAPAFAHAQVKATSPQSGSTVHGNLTRIAVTFTEKVTLVPHALRMTTDRGIEVNLETARLNADGTVLSANVQDHLATGHYAVAWRVEADDGHLETSTFAFAVAAAAAPTSNAGTPPPIAPAPADEPLWPVLVAAAIAIAGGLGAGIAVRRGFRLVRTAPIPADQHTGSPSEHGPLRLPM
jgi:methionine-rich copper-binding protein CopC